MKKFYMKVFRGNLIGSPIKLEESDTRIQSENLIICTNYSDFDSDLMIIKSRSIVNGQVLFVFENIKDLAPILANLKRQKREFNKQKYLDQLDNGCLSSLGFNVNNDLRSLENLKNRYSISTDSDSIKFRDLANQYHQITRAQLNTIINDIVSNSLSLLEAKWSKDSEIDQATTVEALRGIEI